MQSGLTNHGLRGLALRVSLRGQPGWGHLPESENVYVYVCVYVYAMPVKTTILLREDVRDHLLIKVGPRGLSEAINKILVKALFSQQESLFGADPWLKTKGLRDERDVHEDL